MPQQIVAQELLLRGFQLDGQIRMTGWPFRSTGWPFGHPVNMLGEALGPSDGQMVLQPTENPLALSDGGLL